MVSIASVHVCKTTLEPSFGFGFLNLEGDFDFNSFLIFELNYFSCLVKKPLVLRNF